MVGNDIEITVLEVRGEQVRLGIRAPRTVTVHRKEVFEQIRLENESAASAAAEPLPDLGNLVSKPAQNK